MLAKVRYVRLVPGTKFWWPNRSHPLPSGGAVRVTPPPSGDRWLPWQWIASTWQRMPTTIRCLAPGYQDSDIGNSWLRRQERSLWKTSDQPFLGSTNACSAMIPPAVRSTNPSHLGGLRAFLGEGAVCMKTSLATELASTALVFVILCKARVLVSFNTKLSTSRNCRPKRSKITPNMK
jgi:hypothetical protein